MTGLFCPLSLSAGRFAPFINHHTALTPLEAPHHSPHTLPLPPLPPHLPPLRGTSYQKSLGALCSFSTVLNVAMLFSRAARCALSHTHIASRKIVLAAHFFSLVLMLQDARLLFCSTPSHITPHPSPGSNPTANYTSLVIFSTILDVYMFAPPPSADRIILFTCRTAAFVLKLRRLWQISLPRLSLVAMDRFPFEFLYRFPPFFNLFACFNAFAGVGLIQPPSPRRCSVCRASALPLFCAFCVLVCLHASPSIGACITFNAETPF